MATTTTNTNAPAMVTLASTLLTAELDQQRTSHQLGPWLTGIETLDSTLPKDLWMSGRVIGIASVEESDSLAPYIVAQHLLSLHDTAEPSASTFILSPPAAATRAISILHALLTSGPSHSADALELLSTVQLHRHLDAAGLAESLEDISSHLHTTSTISTSDTSQLIPRKMIVYLTSLTANFQASSNNSSQRTNQAAMLAGVMRTLTHLSRTYPNVLVLVDLDLDRDSQPPTHSSANTKPLPLPSGFSGTHLSLCPGGSLGGVLEKACDVIVAVHTLSGDAQSRQSKRVVEIVKDRTGGSFGSWGIGK